MPPGNDECGNECPEGEASNGCYCNDCPVKQSEDDFKSIVSDELNEKLKSESGKYRFESLVDAVLNILDLEDLPKPERTIKTHRLINILKSERNRIERINRFNESASEK